MFAVASALDLLPKNLTDFLDCGSDLFSFFVTPYGFKFKKSFLQLNFLVEKVHVAFSNFSRVI